MSRRVIPLVLLLAVPALLRADPIADAWRAGDVQTAAALVREALAAAPAAPALLAWSARLEPEPSAAALDALPRVERAALAWGRGDPDAAASLVRGSDGSLLEPLLAGLVAARRDDPDAARGALAAIRPESPDFARARYQLALLAVAAGEDALARRYLDTAAEAPQRTSDAAILALRWKLDREIDPRAARRHLRELSNRFPRSLHLARVRETQRRDRELLAAAADTLAAAAESAPAARWALQLAAFTDRGRAIAFRDAWREMLPDLRIVDDRDRDGRQLYRVRSGRFATRAQATAAAERLRRRHDLETLIVESRDAP